MKVSIDLDTDQWVKIISALSAIGETSLTKDTLPGKTGAEMAPILEHEYIEGLVAKVGEAK